MAERIRLTDERIRRFSCPSDKEQAFLWDDDVKRMAVRATAAGVKSFIVEGKLDTGQKSKITDKPYISTIRKTIGSVENWTLEDARKEARRLQTLLDRGIDPRELDQEKKQLKALEREKAAAMKKYTLQNLLEAYVKHLKAQNKVKSSKSAASVVSVHVIKRNPALSRKPAAEVSSNDIADIIRQVRDSGLERTAGLLRSTLKAAFNCGLRAAYDTSLPESFNGFKIVSNPVDPIKAIPVRAGHRTLSAGEVKAYLSELGEDLIDLALKLAFYSGGQRMAQILRAEVSDWNPDIKVLRLFDPKGKRTQPREHLLPLGPVAADIVKALVERSNDRNTALLFPSRRRTLLHDSQIGPRVTEISKKIKSEPFDLRDIRRTVETMLAGMGVSRDIRAQLLSHGLSGVQAQHYDRHDYLKEKHGALLKWERLLNRIASGQEEKKVVQFPERK